MRFHVNIADIVALITAGIALVKVLLSSRKQAVDTKKLEADVLEKYKDIASTSAEQLMEISQHLQKAEVKILSLSRKVTELESANKDLAKRVETLEESNRTLNSMLQEAYEAIRTLMRGIAILIEQIEDSELVPKWKPPKEITEMLNERHA